MSWLNGDVLNCH